MEELGIGRPSTYASTLNVLRDREYVRLDKKRLYPEDKGRLVTAFLESFFSRYVEYDFTADLEEKLDLISAGKLEWKDVLRDFWREFIAAVNDIGDLRITQVLDALNDLLGPHIFPDQGTAAIPRLPVLQRRPLEPQGRQVRRLHRLLQLSRCRFTRQLADTNGEKAALAEAKVLGTDPETGLDVTLRTGRFGPYVQLGEQNGGEKPKRASIPKGTDPQSLDLRQALALLSLPREVGLHPENRASRSWRASAATALTSSTTANMPASAVPRRCSRSASIAPSACSPRRRRHRAAGAAPTSSRSSASIPSLAARCRCLTGRYGPYVKHGKVNATMPKDREPEQVTHGRGGRADRRARRQGPGQEEAGQEAGTQERKEQQRGRRGDGRLSGASG